MPEAVSKNPVIVRAARAIPLALIDAYKRFVSPLVPRSCRFVPTCSEYAALAIGKHGFLKGFALAVWRLLRCQPFARGGYDPVR